MKGKIRIKIKGHLNDNWKDWFEGMEILYEGNCTILCGEIKDEPYLHGILNKIRDLNLELISIKRKQME